MKKLIKMMGLLTIAAALFAGCKDPNSTASDSFAECSETITADEVELSAGSWTVKGVMTRSDSDLSQITEIKATVDENGDYTFTSGTVTESIDIVEAMSLDENAYNALSAAEKEQVAEIFKAYLPEGATCSLNGRILTVTMTLTDTQLQQARSSFDLTEVPENATIKANSAKTKYVITITETDTNNNGETYTETYTYYFSKD